jgi:hypothetical protein
MDPAHGRHNGFSSLVKPYDISYCKTESSKTRCQALLEKQKMHSTSMFQLSLKAAQKELS